MPRAQIPPPNVCRGLHAPGTVPSISPEEACKMAERRSDRRLIGPRVIRHHVAWIAGWFLCVIVILVAPGIRAETGPAEPSRTLPQLSQANTIAVCSEDDCDCGSSPLVSKELAPCTVTSLSGGCTSGSGACCVCTVSLTIAVCGEEDCDCGAAKPLTRVNAPCTVTATTGSCTAASGACCVCNAK